MKNEEVDLRDIPQGSGLMILVHGTETQWKQPAWVRVPVEAGKKTFETSFNWNEERRSGPKRHSTEAWLNYTSAR